MTIALHTFLRKIKCAFSFKKNPEYLWLVLFLFLQLANWKDGGINPGSRYALLASISNHQTLQIDRYVEWTIIDWVQTPDGHYYSNKAPGPALIAAPLAWALDRYRIHSMPESTLQLTHSGETRVSLYPIHYMGYICLLTQVIPFIILTLLSIQLLKEMRVSRAALNFSVLALLFGNTAALFMSTFFGHGMAACFVTALTFCLLRKNYYWVGFFYGIAVLCDYGAVFLLIPLLITILFNDEKLKPWTNCKTWLLPFLAGGILPGILFGWYHTVCFGKPWILPFRYQNPIFTEATSSYQLWGVAAPLPKLHVFYELLFGNKKGIFFTQPWFYGVFIGILFRFRKVFKRPVASNSTSVALSHSDPNLTPPFPSPLQKKTSYAIWTEKVLSTFSVLGFLGLLWMNAGFNGWHGGGTPGPRYLSLVFPLVALLAGYVYDSLKSPVRFLMWAGLIVSIALFLFVYHGPITAPESLPVWKFFWDEYRDSGDRSQRLLFDGFTIAMMILIGLYVYRRGKKAQAQIQEQSSALNSGGNAQLEYPVI